MTRQERDAVWLLFGVLEKLSIIPVKRFRVGEIPSFTRRRQFNKVFTIDSETK